MCAQTMYSVLQHWSGVHIWFWPGLVSRECKGELGGGGVCWWCPAERGGGEILPGKVLEKVIIMICPDVWENCVMKNKLLNGLGQSSMQGWSESAQAYTILKSKSHTIHVCNYSLFQHLGLGMYKSRYMNRCMLTLLMYVLQDDLTMPGLFYHLKKYI